MFMQPILNQNVQGGHAVRRLVRREEGGASLVMQGRVLEPMTIE